MPYGTIKIDTITFTDAGVDKSIAVSGLVQNPTFTGNVTATGTISGATVRATTVSGVTVSGTTANFASGVFTTQISGAIYVAPAGTAGAPSVQVGTGASIAPGLYSPATDQLGISTGGSFRLVVDSTGRVGIGTSSPASLFHLNGPASGGGAIFSSQNYNYATISQVVSSADAVFGGGVIASDVGGEVKKITADVAHYVKMQIGEGITFHTNITGASGTSVSRTTNERMRIDSSGRLLVGTSNALLLGSSLSNFAINNETLVGGGVINHNIGATRHGGTTPEAGPVICLARSRGTTIGAVTLVANGDTLGLLEFSGADGTDFGTSAAIIKCEVDGTPGANDMPGRLVFSTTADGASSPTERARIPNGGGLSVGSTVSPNALTQASGIRLGGSTIASHDFTNITTSPVVIANGVGLGGLGFIQAFNTSTGAQYTGIIMWRSGVVAVVSESNSLGFGLTYSVSGSTLRLQTASGTVTGSIISMGS